MHKLLVSLLMMISTITMAQELNCEVVVNAQLTGNENLQLFKNLEKQLKEFINNTNWTDREFKPQERISCNIVVNVNDYTNDLFKASMQIQASRPVYNSSYTTPIYNFNDPDFSFRYLEFQNINFNENQFESNLVSVIAFHIYMILGLDADTFELNGGEQYYDQAQRIIAFSQQSNFKGWKAEDGLQSRFVLMDNLFSPTFKEFRTIMYQYHRNGLDLMADNARDGKQNISDTLLQLDKINSRRPNSFLMRTFFDAKAEEIRDIFSGGPNVKITQLVSMLNRIAPIHSGKWKDITF